MKFPEPAPGLVIRYSFLWKEDYDKGKYEASKDRPCAIVLATKVKDTTAIQVVVVPITHSQPDQADGSASLEIPAAIAKSLGLDGGRHWLRLTQLNRFIWPGYDLRPRLDDPSRVDYGFIPEPFFNQIKAAIIAENNRRRLSFTPRDEQP
ncbi:hypothetical protein RLEG12_03945 (plasmid) [Rhizobium leguminosarum bv. trifolii CB782]|uniref:Growth inhibitor PemK n=1 Tax=Rhizobium hidalgonense TaxID=1538159 RepID=A0A2A6KEF1_9HYPH|nr:hypothetical protein [Rhizobium hidalgonense]AHG48063.1 hypothetical protein RLEG12_03945 [Rhizobium leguminosarum bv. trifolii CB782]MDR9773311.1 hypothetical protein [Rhizobium hidalgonense]MDR9802984.1 hypothetical protein [Rhizobium hidalgonense]MDR9810394.1 hypothetical protein [Rhizobium hidalgonense]MDR9819020.1 hypothetical protein [Rhizobium hidalgonense]